MAAEGLSLATRMDCYIYRGHKEPQAYLYLANKDDFEAAPEALRTRLGALEFVMELELTPERTLARADPERVREALTEQGWYFQPPPPKNPLLKNDRLVG